MTRTVLLGDIARKITKGTTPTTYGANFTDSGINFVKVESITAQGGFLTDKFVYIDENTHNNMLKRSIIEEGDILLTMAGAIGRVAQVPKEILPANTNQAISIIRIDRDDVDSRYVRYFLESPDAKSQFIGGITQSAQPNLSLGNISKIQLPLFDLTTQKKIADILGTIDEKIELNRKMNETLEQMGQALFKKHFITNPEAERWENGTIADLGEVITGKTPSKSKAEYYGNNVMFLKVPDMHSKSIIIKTEDMLSSIGADSQSNKYIPKWSTCVSCIATVGVVSLAGERLQTNQQINSIVPKSKNHTLFNYYLLKSKAEMLRTMASGGSATPNLNKGHFESIKIKLPPTGLLERFQNEVEGFLDMVYQNTRQIQTLTTLRDTLLPRLINGTVKV